VLVPSLFVKKSLLAAGVAEEKIHVLPFGTDEEWLGQTNPCNGSKVFLHVGQLSIRKGTHRLLRAWKQIGAYRTCELRLIGSMRLPKSYLGEFQGIYNYLGRIPRQSLKQHYSTAACFVFPALAEGFALVVLESLSCGTPVVASRNSGAEGFITEGEHGLLHDAQDDEQLCEALEWMLTHPNRREEMRAACLERARKWTWSEYRTAFLEFIVTLMDGHVSGEARKAS
jgi:glycosyltransferase involved in cell wall biosynthesis